MLVVLSPASPVGQRIEVGQNLLFARYLCRPYVNSLSGRLGLRRETAKAICQRWLQSQLIRG